ncbi:MAG: LysR family transcriptional regulator [Intestinibacter sp.]|uniref:LysR family transcriptional regulator n=1 Tax=Intestinibacter sp. TaxID=1965304 RepID=UPI003F181689
MNLNHLQYFVKLAHLEHYTKAAKDLSITQPSLSHAISALEEELGTKLFEKHGRNVVLTKYGKIFLKYVEKSLDSLQEGIDKTKALTCSTSGVIDLGYIYTLEAEFVPMIVRRFLKENEDKNFGFTFSSSNTKSIIEGLKNERFDIGFCSMVEDENSIEFIKIKEEELVVVVPKNHELSKYKEIDLVKTVGYKHIAFTKSSGLRPVIDNLFKQINKKQDISYEVEKDESMAGLVAENFGIAVMPNIPFLKYFNVDIIKLKSPVYSRNIYMAKLKNKYVSPAVDEFSKFVLRNCKMF